MKRRERPRRACSQPAAPSQPLLLLLGEDCLCFGCNNTQLRPHQPRDFGYALLTKHPKNGRTFQASWYDRFSWLSFCTRRRAAFCFYCQWGAARPWEFAPSKAETTFTTRGFTAWKRAIETYRNHEASQVHGIAVGLWALRHETPASPQVASAASATASASVPNTIIDTPLVQHLTSRFGRHSYCVIIDSSGIPAKAELRWVDTAFRIHQDFLGVVNVSGNDEEDDRNLRALLDIQGLNPKHCIGFSFRGIENKDCYLPTMDGEVQAILQQAAAKIPPCEQALQLVAELHHLVHTKPQQILPLEGIKGYLQDASFIKTATFTKILEHYEPICEALEALDDRSDVSSLMRQFDTFFGLRLCHMLFAISTIATESLAGELTLAKSSKILTITRQALIAKACHAVTFHQEMATTATRLSLQGMSNEDSTSAYEDYYRQAFDALVNAIDRLLEHPAIHRLHEIETALVDAWKRQEVSFSQDTADYLSRHVHLSMLLPQMMMLAPLLYPCATAGAHDGGIAEVVAAFRNCRYAEDLLPVASRLMRIYLAYPLGTPQRS